MSGMYKLILSNFDTLISKMNSVFADQVKFSSFWICPIFSILGNFVSNGWDRSL